MLHARQSETLQTFTFRLLKGKQRTSVTFQTVGNIPILLHVFAFLLIVEQDIIFIRDAASFFLHVCAIRFRYWSSRAAIYCARICTRFRQNRSKRWERWNIVGLYIPYGLFQTTGEMCAKFGSDRFRNVDLYTVQTNIHLYI